MYPEVRCYWWWYEIVESGTYNLSNSLKCASSNHHHHHPYHPYPNHHLLMLWLSYEMFVMVDGHSLSQSPGGVEALKCFRSFHFNRFLFKSNHIFPFPLSHHIAIPTPPGIVSGWNLHECVCLNQVVSPLRALSVKL